MEQRVTHWDRFHSNNTLASVMRLGGTDFAATATPIDGTTSSRPLTWADSLDQAQSKADLLAHPGCDGSCPNWMPEESGPQHD